MEFKATIAACPMKLVANEFFVSIARVLKANTAFGSVVETMVKNATR